MPVLRILHRKVDSLVERLLLSIKTAVNTGIKNVCLYQLQYCL